MSLGRLLLLSAGLACFGLGTLGIALPVLPTVPFYLLAAFCFARSNPAWERRLLEHPRYGPPLKRWRERRAISRGAKLSALAAMATGALLTWALLDWPLALAATAVVAAPATWIWTRAE